MSHDDPHPRVVLVTGPAGAGRSSAINVLEDIGFEAIDNLPLSLVSRLLTEPLERSLALGIDPRNREFSLDSLLNLIRALTKQLSAPPEILYLDCSHEVLLKRYSETRRRHPMAPDSNPSEGIVKEIALLSPIRAMANYLVDTTGLSVHDLKAELKYWFEDASTASLSVTLLSFSYKRGLPRQADIVLDCRFLANPHWNEGLRPFDGRTDQVQQFVMADPKYQPFFDQVCNMLTLLLPAYKTEGKAHLTVGFGCTGGKHRSVTLAEQTAKALDAAGWWVSIRHREVEQAAAASAAQLG